MKPWLVAFLATVIVAIGLGLFWGGWSDAPASFSRTPRQPASAPVPSAPAPGPSAAASTPAPAPSAPGTPPSPAVMPSPEPPGPTGSSSRPEAEPMPNKTIDQQIAEARMEIDKVGLVFRDFRTLMGSNPVGTNAEITAAISGDNPKKARLGPPEGQQINGRGELLDPWGTPYFFHQQSATDMEIHSAGPDKKFATSDDILGR